MAWKSTALCSKVLSHCREESSLDLVKFIEFCSSKHRNGGEYLKVHNHCKYAESFRDATLLFVSSSCIEKPSTLSFQVKISSFSPQRLNKWLNPFILLFFYTDLFLLVEGIKCFP